MVYEAEVVWGAVSEYLRERKITSVLSLDQIKLLPAYK